MNVDICCQQQLIYVMYTLGCTCDMNMRGWLASKMYCHLMHSLRNFTIWHLFITISEYGLHLELPKYNYSNLPTPPTVVLNFLFICFYWSDYMLMQLVFCKFWSLYQVTHKLMKNVLSLLIVKSMDIKSSVNSNQPMKNYYTVHIHAYKSGTVYLQLSATNLFSVTKSAAW
jgi:hypothetical protein